MCGWDSRVGITCVCELPYVGGERGMRSDPPPPLYSFLFSPSFVPLMIAYAINRRLPSSISAREKKVRDDIAGCIPHALRWGKANPATRPGCINPIRYFFPFATELCEKGEATEKVCIRVPSRRSTSIRGLLTAILCRD